MRLIAGELYMIKPECEADHRHYFYAEPRTITVITDICFYRPSDRAPLPSVCGRGTLSLTALGCIATIAGFFSAS